MSQIQKPFLPSDRTDGMRSRELSTSIGRAICILARGALHGVHARETKGFEYDRTARDIVSKNAVTPASTSETSLLQTAVSTLATIMGPGSAAGQLIPRLLHVSLEGLYAVQVPSVIADGDSVGWVGEGQPFPARKSTLAAVTLSTKKFGSITVLTREMVEHSSAPTLINDLLARNLSLSFEKFLFGTDAASSSQPAGLLKDISATTETSGGTDLAMLTDLANIGASVAAVAGQDLFFIAGPSAGLKISIRAPFFKYPLAISTAVADDSVICLSPSAVAIAGGLDAVKLDTSRQTTLHMVDTNPLPLTSATSASFPIRSLAQSDTIGVRIRCDIDWALRSSSGIAFVENITW